jgi:hypothetical protein
VTTRTWLLLALTLLVLGCKQKKAAGKVGADAGVVVAAPPPRSSATPAAIASTSSSAPPAIASSSETTLPEWTGSPIRETRTLDVDGVTETWQLRWRSPPKLDCVDRQWGTCPCWGFAFAESGDLELVRKRPGERDDILNLRKLWGEDDLLLQKWIPTKTDDMDAEFTREKLTKHRIATIMSFEDYDHDGRATEFLFRIGPRAGACGHTSTVLAIGISKAKPKLHVFMDSDKPSNWMEFQMDDWEKIRTMTPDQPLKIIDWPCGDHASETEESRTLVLDSAGGFHQKHKRRSCTPAETGLR